MVSNRSNILYEEGFGYHSPISTAHPTDPSKSIFVIASLSKTFLALSTMQLIEKSKTLSSIISKFHDFIKTNLTDVILPYALNKVSWLIETPGNVTYYTNVGAAWSVIVIERITGLSFEDYVSNHILDQLDILNTKASYRLSTFETRKTDLVEHFVYNVSLLSSQFHRLWLYIPQYGISVYPLAMFRMSARTLPIYLLSFLNNFTPRLLQNSSSVDQMLRIVRREGSVDELNVRYALIWNWQYHNYRSLVGHREWMPGVAHTMMVNEERTLGVILFSNGDITWGDDLAKEISLTLVDITRQLFDCFEK